MSPSPSPGSSHRPSVASRWATPTLTRWAWMVERAMLSHLASHHDLVPWATCMGLCQMAIETRGYPTRVNPTTGAMGLLQQIPRFRSSMGDDWARWSPEVHIGAYARVVASRLAPSGEDLPSISFTWASGEGGFLTWLKTGQTKQGKSFANHLSYMRRLWLEAWPEISGWFAGWVLSGRPGSQGRVVAGDGQTYEVFWATHDHGGPVDQPLANPFDGTFSWLIDGQKVRRRLVPSHQVPARHRSTVVLGGLTAVQAALLGLVLGAGLGLGSRWIRAAYNSSQDNAHHGDHNAHDGGDSAGWATPYAAIAALSEMLTGQRRTR